MAVYANLTIDQGSDFTSVVNVDDANNNPADLTGYTARGQVRKTYGSTTAYDFTASITTPLEGKVVIELSNTVTGSLKPGRYVYDVEVVSASGTVTRVIEGQIEVTPSATRLT